MPIYNRSFADINLDFAANPVTGDIDKVKDSVSVKRGIRNVLLSQNGERLFNPEFGSGIRNLLFEPMTDLTAERLEDECRDAINAWEDRAEIIQIVVSPDPDYLRYRVAIIFRIVNEIEEQTLELFLDRER